MRRLRSLLLVPLGTALTACALLGEAGPRPTTTDATAVPVPDAIGTATDDAVALPLYFRAGEDAGAHLERATRRVAVDQDLPRRALELLVAGPSNDESGLLATLPVTTQVRGIDVSGGTAHVVLSPEAVRDAALVGDSPANEALALASITNTLTEFGSVDRVTLDVEGQGVTPGEFWGGWGVPGVLVRDEALIGDGGDGGGVLDLGRFSGETQWTGSEDAPPVVLGKVRVRDQLTHVRVTAELYDPEDPDANVEIPRVRARGSSDGIVIDLNGIEDLAPELEDPRDLALSDPAFRHLLVDHGDRHSAIRVLVDDAREREFWLHSVTGPTRIVLDVRK